MDKIEVFVEAGKTRTFAGAVEWPGWCRSGRDEAAALQALLDYGPRYAKAVRSTRLGFEPPAEVAAFAVAERLPGTTTTDFGAPEATLASDARPVPLAELRRLIALLRASWKTLDAAAEAALGSELRKGPRGGGRELQQIVEHVRMAEEAYLGRLGGKPAAPAPGLDPALALRESRKAVLRALEHSANGELPARGPRGGLRWTARYFARRAAWHVLDHAWEIEDRAQA
jgi:hypothetical protein